MSRHGENRDIVYRFHCGASGRFYSVRYNRVGARWWA